MTEGSGQNYVGVDISPDERSYQALCVRLEQIPPRSGEIVTIERIAGSVVLKDQYS